MKNKHLTLKRALFLSAPFLLIALSIILFSLSSFELIIKNNDYFKVITNSPQELSSVQQENFMTPIIDSLGEIQDEEKLERLEESNTDMTIRSDFPPITIGQQWATITIESAQVYDVPVYHGGGDLLMQGIGHATNSRFPGQNGKIVLSGHVGIKTHFQRLETMQVGDLVEINTIYGDYVYRVTKTKIHDENDSSWLRPEEEETEDKLICYTCYPYDNNNQPRTQRFAIICEKVSGEDWTVPAQ